MVPVFGILGLHRPRVGLAPHLGSRGQSPCFFSQSGQSQCVKVCRVRLHAVRDKQACCDPVCGLACFVTCGYMLSETSKPATVLFMFCVVVFGRFGYVLSETSKPCRVGFGSDVVCLSRCSDVICCSGAMCRQVAQCSQFSADVIHFLCGPFVVGGVGCVQFSVLVGVDEDAFEFVLCE